MKLLYPPTAVVEAASPERDAFQLLRWHALLGKPELPHEMESKRVIEEKLALVDPKRREMLENVVGYG
jgi:hypothetical protein